MDANRNSVSKPVENSRHDPLPLPFNAGALNLPLSNSATLRKNNILSIYMCDLDCGERNTTL